MPKKRVKPEQVVPLLRQIEVAVANGKTTPQACKDAEVTEQTYYRWRKEYGGLRIGSARWRSAVRRQEPEPRPAMTEKETMSRGRGPRTGRPAAEGANVGSLLDLAAYLTKAERP